jgi:hypothetical protein
MPLHLSVFIRANRVMHARIIMEFYGEGHQPIEAVGVVGVGNPGGGSGRTTHGWRQYEGKVEVPEGAESMVLALELQGPGQVWFDELVVRP